MHPEDVRELVAEQVADLKRLLKDRPQLGVEQVELDETDILITIKADRTASTEVPAQLRVEIAGQKKVFIPGGPGRQNIHVFDVPAEVPLLGQTTERKLLLRLRCDGYDGRPPLAELLRPEDRSPLPDDEWPRDPSGQGIVAAHPKYKRKFFCRPGLREFHEHDQHADRPWDAIREQTTIGWQVVTLLGDLQTRWML